METKDHDILISVVTVCRNVLDDLKKTVDSVARQTCDDMEFLIVDGASTDGTVPYLDTLPPAVRRISEPDRGIYDAMNKGVAIARGEYVIFMNAGDTFADSDTLARVSADIAANGRPDVVYGDVIKKDREGNDGVKKAEAPHLSHRMTFCHQSAFALRERLLENPFDISHRLSADYKFFMTQLRDRRKFLKLEYPVSRFDTGGVSNRRRSAGLADNMRVIRELLGPLRGLPLILHILPTFLISKARGK